MGRRLILDTNVLIAHECGTIDRSALDDDDLAVAAITIAEYRVGIELADDVERGRTVLTRDVTAGFAGLPDVLAIDAG